MAHDCIAFFFQSIWRLLAFLGHYFLVLLQQTHSIRVHVAQLLPRGGGSQLSPWPAPTLEPQHPADQQRGLRPCSLFCSDRCWCWAAFPASRQLQRHEGLAASQKAKLMESVEGSRGCKGVKSLLCFHNPGTAKDCFKLRWLPAVAGTFAEARTQRRKNHLKLNRA